MKFAIKNYAVMHLILGLTFVVLVGAQSINDISSPMFVRNANKKQRKSSDKALNVYLWLMPPNSMPPKPSINTPTNNSDDLINFQDICKNTIKANSSDSTNKFNNKKYIKNPEESSDLNILDVHIDDLKHYSVKYVSRAISKACKKDEDLVPGSGFTPQDTDILVQICANCSCFNSTLYNRWAIGNNIDKTKEKVVVYVNGLTTKDDKTFNNLKRAYLCRSDSNFVLVDIASHVKNLRTWYTMDLESIGKSLGKSLFQLQPTVPASNIHLIGQSLGAHIVGHAARLFRSYTQSRMPRITALDPANLCFMNPKEGLHVSDAEFVDVIHTNPSVLGLRYPMGTVDFYPGGLDAKRKGCHSVVCSHLRAAEYYAETVFPGNEWNFMGVPCSSLRKMREEVCTSNVKYMIPMGYATPNSAKAYYFMDVNEKSPYGHGAKPRPPFAKGCRKCSELVSTEYISAESSETTSFEDDLNYI